LIVPFIDRLIAVGILPEPEEYTVVWPDTEAMSDQEKAAVASTKTAALAQYVQGGVESLIAPVDYLTKILNFTDEETKAVLETAEAEYEEKQLEEEQKQQQEAMKAAGTTPVQLAPGQSLEEEQKQQEAFEQQQEAMKAAGKPIQFRVDYLTKILNLTDEEAKAVLKDFK
jgi:hypothetical protein